MSLPIPKTSRCTVVLGHKLATDCVASLDLQTLVPLGSRGQRHIKFGCKWDIFFFSVGLQVPRAFFCVVLATGSCYVPQVSFELTILLRLPPALGIYSFNGLLHVRVVSTETCDTLSEGHDVLLELRCLWL